MKDHNDENVSSPLRREIVRATAMLAFLRLAPAWAWPAKIQVAENIKLNDASVELSHVHLAGDGTSLFFKDWGAGRPIIFSHGWPLDADAWDPQMLFMAAKGFV